MKRVTIGIFGSPSDVEVSSLAERLCNRGAEPWVVDLATIPVPAGLAWGRGAFLVGGRDLLDMGAAYLRRTGRTLPPYLSYGEAPSEKDTRQWDARRLEAAAILQKESAGIAIRTALLTTLARHRTVVNPPHLQRLHRLKPLLLDRLRRAGVPVPPFVAGTAREPLETLARFAGKRAPARTGETQLGRTDGPPRSLQTPAVVVKPLAGIYKTRAWDATRAATHPWTERPVLLQHFVHGEVVRAYVLEGRILAAARIVHQGTVDSSESQTGIEPVSLPSSAKDVALLAARTAGADFCGLDLVIDFDAGHAFVIDVNFSPMFVAFSRLSRRDIAGHLADYLIRAGRRGQDGGRPPVLDTLERAKELLAEDPGLEALLARGRRPES